MCPWEVVCLARWPQNTHRLRTLESKATAFATTSEFSPRIFGNKIYVDIEIALDGTMTLQQAHNIAEEVHDEIENDFPKVKHIMVHVNPEK